MKLTNKFKKMFALFFVLVVVIPLTSSFGLWEMLADSENAYATGNDVVTEGTDATVQNADSDISTGNITYKFSIGVDADIYDHDAQVSFNGETQYGVFSNNIKETSDNTKLKVQDLGTLENPYVVLEVTPSATLSTIRQHVADKGYFDFTQEQLDSIELTPNEKSVVRLQALYQLMSDDEGQSKLADYRSSLADLEAERTQIRTYIGKEYEDEILAELIKMNPNYEWWYPQEVYEAVLDDFCILYSPRYSELLVDITNLEAVITAFDILNTVNKRPEGEEIAVTLDRIEKSIIDSGIVTEEEYTAYINGRIKYATEYKRDYYQSLTYNKLLGNSNYRYNYKYETRYEVDSNGNFAFYKDGDTKSVVTTSNTQTHSAMQNELKQTTTIVNPLALWNWLSAGNPNNKLVKHDNTFVKGCLDTAYNSVITDTGKVISQTPFIDEYIFAGWSIKAGDEFVSINTLEDDYNLVENGVTQLYTNWVVRYYEKDTYEVLTTPGYVTVDFDTEDATYSIMLPDCIASKQEGFHDFRNQLTICLAKKSKFIYANSGDTSFRNLYETQEVSYSEEISSWDFNFKMSDYQTVGDLKKVAPKLMADTDYYIATKNAVYNNGVVTYYPYNVLVITMTPDELNKMVYYDPVYNGKSAAVGYQESQYVNTFLDSVDFVFFSNGGSTVYCAGDGGQNDHSNLSFMDPSFGSTIKMKREPIQERNPLLFTRSDDGKLVYDESNIKKSASYAGSSYNSIPDFEWQVAQKIYQRVAEPKDFAQSGKGQSRSMVVVFDESLGDNVSTKAGTAQCLVDTEGNYLNAGTGDNLAKLMLMFFVYKDPTIFYSYYVDEDYTEEFNGEAIIFDKIDGAVRTVGGDGSDGYPEGTYKGSYFTGEMYGYEKWNNALFFPYEYFGVNHVTAMIESGDVDTASVRFKPENPNYPIAQAMYDALGLAKWVNFKKIASPYAYTFNGDNSAASQFFDYTIPEIFNPTNGNEYGGNTDLAFEFFRRVNPFKIVNNHISTKNAIEFMIANAQNSSLQNSKEIVILNRADEKTRFTYGNYTVYADSIIADDFNKLAENIEFMYRTEETGFCVPEILWTQQYSDLSSAYVPGSVLYAINTNESEDSPLKWYKMPVDLDNSNKNDYYITYNIENSVSTDVGGNDVTVRTLTKEKSLYKYLDGNMQTVTTDDIYIEPESEYYVEALLKPIIDGKTWDQRTYIVAVKQYNSYNDYVNDKEPESITVKNVVIEKLSYLFNLD